MKQIQTIACVGLAAFVAAGCGLSQGRHSANPAPKTDAEFLQQLQQTPEWRQRAKLFNLHKTTAAAILTHATRVQVFRLITSGHETALGKVSGVSYFAQGPEQKPPFAARLASIVLDPKNYPFPGCSTKQCFIEPGVDFRVWRGQQFADIIVCFSCNQLAVMENNPSVPKTTIGGWLNGRCYVAGDFDAVRPQIAVLAKEALPGDAAMQAL